MLSRPAEGKSVDCFACIDILQQLVALRRKGSSNRKRLSPFYELLRRVDFTQNHRYEKKERNNFEKLRFGFEFTRFLAKRPRNLIQRPLFGGGDTLQIPMQLD